MKPFITSIALISLAGLVGACDGSKDTSSYPVDNERARKSSYGKLTGDGLTVFGGKSDKDGNGGSSPIGVNSFLWRATLDTLSFMPLSSADPFGGVILSDWYEDPTTPGKRFKINALILDRSLRADGVKISLFKQENLEGTWKDVAVDDAMSHELENTILTRARQLKVKQAIK